MLKKKAVFASCKMLSFSLFIVFPFLFSACGDSDHPNIKPGVPIPDNPSIELEKPVLKILFPSQNGLTDAETLTIKGRASDPDGVAAVRVNGLDATTNDGFANWQALVPLDQGDNKFVVETENRLGNINANAATLNILRTRQLQHPQMLALDIASNRAFVLDFDPGNDLISLVSVDLSTGNVTIVSNATTGTGAGFISPQSLALDIAGNRAFVTDFRFGIRKGEVISVDLSTGNRTIVSNATTGTGITFGTPFGLALDIAGNRAFLLDSGLDALVKVDLSTGNRTIVSNATTGTGTDFDSPTGLALDIAGNRAFVIDLRLDALVSVDLSTGNRTVISRSPFSPIIGKGRQFFSLRHIKLDVAHNRAFVLGSDHGVILYSVDLTTGDRTIVSNTSTQTGIPPIGTGGGMSSLGLALDIAGNRAIVGLVSVNLSTGDRSGIVKNIQIGTGPRFRRPDDLALDIAGNRAFLVDSVLVALVKVDLSTGNRTIISNATIGTGIPFSALRSGLALDIAGNRAFVLDFDAGNDLISLVSVNLTTGDRTIVSNVLTSKGVVFKSPFIRTFDVAGNRVFLEDRFQTPVLISVDLSTGNRTIISNPTTGTSTSSFPRPFTLDVAGNRALSLNSKFLIAVNLTTGVQTIISGPPIDTRQNFGRTIVSTFDLASNQAFGYVLANTTLFDIKDALFSVNLSTLAIRIISDRIDDRATTIGMGPNFSMPGRPGLDISGKRAFILNLGLNAIVIVDLESGDRVIMSK